jgi:hypothetical protein
MTIDAFRGSLMNADPPAEISPLLQALWYDAKNDWQRAHNIAQDIDTDDGSWIHAYLHRKEGDHGNAAYWYRRAGRPVPRMDLEEEWQRIATELLKRNL